ncbi:nucleotide exchange factor GrpE [bacterium]|nr:nucleotide exchange factor GrpE [bacterium]
MTKEEKGSKKGSGRVSISRKRWLGVKEKAKLAEEHYERLLRLQAEFENYRKRANKERAEFLQYAIEDLICDLLPVMDNFERAIESSRNCDNSKALLQGIEMVQKQMKETLRRKGLDRIESVGKEFNPNEHEAMEHVENDEHPDHTVLEELQPGYRLKEKIIRPATVKVSKKKEVEGNAKADRN